MSDVIPIEANCPYCGEAMELGKAKVHSTMLGMIFVGFSNQHLSFFPKGEEKVRILSSGNRVKAHHCNTCGATVIPKKGNDYKWLD